VAGPFLPSPFSVLRYFPPMKNQALPGFREFTPVDLWHRSHIFEKWRSVAARYGFEEYDGPPLEPLELYTAKSGDEIVGQLYAFKDKGEREVALRPEMTPTLARMVAASAKTLRKPIRWFSIPQLFRYERQQRGRLREHFQLNCDLIGEPGPLGDAEIIALALDVMRAFGLGPQDVRVRLSDRRLLGGILAALELGGDRERLAHQALDKVGRREYGAARQALLDAGAPGQAVKDLESLSSLKDLSEVERRYQHADTARLRTVVDALRAMGLGEFVDLDLTIVRGLAYYTETVFELFDAKRSLRAICGGGRYDNLLEHVGGVPLPAVGFGMGDVVLRELLKDQGLLPDYRPSVDVIVAAVTAEDQPHVLALAHELRDADVRVEYALAELSLAKQLQLANARDARWAVLVGPDERARGEVILKDLAGKRQITMPRDQIVVHLSSVRGA
jgi:histidyl-tRNA synthetase